jgi:hypothetical protein
MTAGALRKAGHQSDVREAYERLYG